MLKINNLKNVILKAGGCMALMLLGTGLKAQTNNPFGHPLIPDMIADASIQVIDDTFYCYATTDGYDNGLKTSGPPVVWKSKDFVHWSFSGCYFPSASGQKYWAPSKAIFANGRYYIYPTINQFMYAAVSDSPDGPFRLAIKPDTFYKPYTSSTLLKPVNGKPPYGIDAEVFVNDDKKAYLFWQKRKAARLHADMITVDTNIITIPTPHERYSEGPIFFKRKGIYYYLYTLGGAESYQYAYVTSKVSPLGPFDFPAQNDIIATTNHKLGIYGPGHGCVFNLPGTDNYYFVYLEFGRGSTNRQTYVNRLEFDGVGAIKPVELNKNGVGALFKVKRLAPKKVINATASSTRSDLIIKPESDTTLHRHESFLPLFAFDGSNGSRWMAAPDDADGWLMADLGKTFKLNHSEVYFVRPTAGHSYLLEYSIDGKNWAPCGGHTDVRIESPHIDKFKITARYLRIRILKGIRGIWEWEIY
jgi:beta-xylosidase